MVTCPTCQTENADEAAFCSKCKSYLRWEDRPATAERPRASLSVQLSADALSVTPGVEGGCDVWVRNGSGDPVEIVLELYESAAAWSSVEPAVLVVAGGGQARAHIRLLPPASGSTVEGPQRLGVRAGRRGDSEGSVAAEAVVSVTGVVDFSLSIDPAASKAYRAATHRVLIENTGNAPVSAQLSASENSGELSLELTDESLDVAADTTAETTLTVNVRRPKRIGRAVEHPFEVVAADKRVESRRVNGVVTTTPSVPMLLVATCAAVLGLGMVVVGVATTALDDDDDPSPTSTEPSPPPTVGPTFVFPTFPFPTFVFPNEIFPDLRPPDFVIATTTTGP